MNYFTIEELCASHIARSENIDNTPSQVARVNMQRLIETTLNPARKQLGCAITVNSGYRSKMLNARVGGVRNSYHLQGRAADLNAGTRQLNLALLKILSTLPHTELINEQNATWIHVAL